MGWGGVDAVRELLDMLGHFLLVVAFFSGLSMGFHYRGDIGLGPNIVYAMGGDNMWAVCLMQYLVA